MTRWRPASFLVALGLAGGLGRAQEDSAAPYHGWLSWRGPDQCGWSAETGLPDRVEVGGENHLWSLPLAGRGTPVTANGRLFTLGYEGEGVDLEECLVCLDEATGEKLWELRYRDFLSDTVYDRYALGSPTVDPGTGNVFFMTSPGLLIAVDRDGKELWEVSLMEEYGRLTFPNGRTGAPLIDGDLVLVHGITTNWGPGGPARDRFYAFDKATGECVWTATPGISPYDSNFSLPVLAWQDGERVLYSGTGCGNVVCINARTGDTLWRYLLASGGINSSPILYRDRLIAVNGQENVDSTSIGCMVALKIGARPEPGTPGPRVLGKDTELWRNDLGAFTSSPVRVGDRVYLTDATGELAAVDVESGKVLWKEKLAPDQIHASPLAADGKLYVPMNNGSFYVIRPTDEKAEILCQVQLEGNCLGAPALSAGRLYVHTTKQLYCFGTGEGELPAPQQVAQAPEAGAAARLQVVPAEVLLRPGDSLSVRVRSLDARGQTVNAAVADVAFQCPPGLEQAEDGSLHVPANAAPGVGMLQATAGELKGSARVRIVAGPDYFEDFEGFAVNKPHASEKDVLYADPPSHWLSSRLKWEVRSLEGGNVLARTLDQPLFQRATTLFGHPDAHDYTMQVDVRSEGNRRSLSSPGVVHQRYLIQIKGNYQELAVSSNDERLKESVPFPFKPDTWYTLKTRVDVAEDGTGTIRAKAWERDQPEPEGWILEVQHENAHRHGAAGLFGLTPQSRFRIFVDNLRVTANEDHS